MEDEEYLDKILSMINSVDDKDYQMGIAILKTMEFNKQKYWGKFYQKLIKDWRVVSVGEDENVLFVECKLHPSKSFILINDLKAFDKMREEMESDGEKELERLEKEHQEILITTRKEIYKASSIDHAKVFKKQYPQLIPYVLF